MARIPRQVRAIYQLCRRVIHGLSDSTRQPAIPVLLMQPTTRERIHVSSRVETLSAVGFGLEIFLAHITIRYTYDKQQHNIPAGAERTTTRD